MRGNCYVLSEALYWTLYFSSDPKEKFEWKPMHMRHEGESHWFLKHSNGMILDLTAKQFKKKPDYGKARGKGFLTNYPSERAIKLMEVMLWQPK